MRYIGVDIGTKHSGIAASDQSGIFAFPVDIVSASDVFDALRRYSEKYSTLCIVVGDGRGFSGQELPNISKKVRTFVGDAEKKGYTVHTQQELYSSVEAGRYTKGGHDKAAAIILQRFLDIQRKV